MTHDPAPKPPPLPAWIRLSILAWSLATIAMALEVNSATTRFGSPSAFHIVGPWLWPGTAAIALSACGLVFLAARRRRIEVALALTTGLGLHALALVWHQYVV